MKKSAISAILSIALLGAAHQACAETKIGTVNMKLVFEKYYKTKDAEHAMNDRRTEVKRDLDEKTEKRKALEAEITKMNEDLKKSEIGQAKKAATQADREKKIAEWQDMMKDLQAFTQEKDKQLQDETLRIRNGIVQEIQKVVSDKVKSEQYDLVFDTSGNSINNVPVVMYANEKYDFTKSVIDALNAGRPAASEDKPAEKTEKPADKPAEKPADKKNK